MELVGWQAVAFSFACLIVTLGATLWGTFAMIHADEAKSRKQALEGATTEDLKRVARELAEIQHELKKRHTPNG